MYLSPNASCILLQFLAPYKQLQTNKRQGRGEVSNCIPLTKVNKELGEKKH